MARAIKHIKAGLLHVEVIGTIPDREPGRRRAGRCRPTCAAQQFYNNKCSWHELELKLATNFGGRDWVLTLTYDDGHLPPDKRSADKFLQKFFRKLRTARRRRKEELRYIYATEGWHGKAEDAWFGGGGRLGDRRLHHHVVLNGTGPGELEEIRSLWDGGGYVRAEPVDIHYYRELAKYCLRGRRLSNRQKQRPGAGRGHRQPGGAAGPDSGVPADGQGRPGGLQGGGPAGVPIEGV